jgi:glycosyltransferase involved in cell wall biosynthesis
MVDTEQFPTYSVLIPTVGRNSLLLAVNSVINQTFPPIEILIVAHADALKTSIQETLTSFDTIRIKTIPKGNAAETRNAGILEAQGEYIAFLDDDDIWAPNKIEVQFSKSSSPVISCRAQYVGWSNHIRPEILFTKNFLSSVYSGWLPRKRKTIISMSSLLINNELAKRIMFDETLSEREDLWFIHQVESKGEKISQISDVLITYASRKPFSERKVSLSSDLDWFNRLETISKGLGWNFLLGVALRNRVFTLDLLGATRLLFLAIFSPFWISLKANIHQ